MQGYGTVAERLFYEIDLFVIMSDGKTKVTMKNTRKTYYISGRSVQMRR